VELLRKEELVPFVELELIPLMEWFVLLVTLLRSVLMELVHVFRAPMERKIKRMLVSIVRQEHLVPVAQ